MSSFVIEGGHELRGEIIPQGAKNEALQVICATLLSSEKITINNIPNILDVNNLIDLLQDMGVKICKLGDNSYSFEAKEINLDYFQSQDFHSKSSFLRGSVMLVGPIKVCILT